MEDKNMDIRKIIYIVAIFLVILVASLVALFANDNIVKTAKEAKVEVYSIDERYVKEDDDERIILVTNVLDYNKVMDEYNVKPEKRLSSRNFKSHNYVYIVLPVTCDESYEYDGYEIDDDELVIYIDDTGSTRYCENSYILYEIPIDKSFTDEDNISISYTLNMPVTDIDNPNVVYKPIMYIYPTSDTNVNVRLADPSVISVSYPKYNDGWNVYAKTDGSLSVDGKYYYALYWDENNKEQNDFSEGFYVTADNAASFLEDKLSKAGLTDREMNEFIMYWLPKLQDNGESIVNFSFTEELQASNAIIVDPAPDSILRVRIHIKKVNGDPGIKEQEIPSFNRNGFTIVEWGGDLS